MPALGKRSFKGQSGTAYRFAIYAYGTRLRQRGGVYLITNRCRRPEGGYSHEVLYVGQGADLSQSLMDSNQSEDLLLRGANCICLQADAGEDSRLAKKQDLIGALQPVCNISQHSGD